MQTECVTYRVSRSSQSTTTHSPCDEAFKVNNEWWVSIADILQFVRHYGRVVISIDDDNIPELEIYDDYRE